MKRGASTAIAAATLLLASASAVFAENVCFEVIAARPNIEPPAPILVDKCSGRSWVLLRNGRNYRWSPIAVDAEKPKTADRVPNEGSAVPDSGSQKCFTFNNRKFCE